MSGLDKNRKRNRIINFRVTPEELEEINNKIIVSGLSRSEYFISSVLRNPKTIYIGKFESDRLSLEFKKLKLFLQEFSKNNDEVQIVNLLKINLDLLENIQNINQKEN